MSLSTALLSKDAKIIELVELTCGKRYNLWTHLGGNKYSVAEADEVTAARFNATTLTKKDSVGELTAYSWTHDGATLTIQLAANNSPNEHDNITQAEITYRFGNVSKNWSFRYYQGRVKSLPNLSFRVESDFQGLTQIGAGTLVLDNGDKFFDAKNGYQWDAGKCTLRVGADTTSVMADHDYESIGVFSIVGWDISDTEASFQLAEIKERLKGSIPTTFFTRAEYPNISEDEVGRPIPIAYGRIFGAEPICTDAMLGQFKLASHAIWAVDAIRIETQNGYEDARHASITLSTATFTLNALGTIDPALIYYPSANTLRLVLTTVSGKFPDPASIGDYRVIIYNDTDYSEDPEADPSKVEMAVTYSRELKQKVYVNTGWGPWMWETPSVHYELRGTVTPGTTVPNETGKTYKVIYKVWNGEKVSVDFHGKTKSDGYWMNNAADIVEDILSTYFSETSLNSTAFTAAEGVLEVGYAAGDSNEKVCVRVPSIYIDDLRSGLDVIDEINSAVGSYLYVNADGEYEYKVFRPQRGEDLSVITQDEMFNYKERYEDSDKPSILRAEYAKRLSEDWSQLYSYTQTDNKYLSNQPANRVKEYEPCFSTTSDTNYFLQRTSVYEGRPRKIISFSVRWRGFLFFPAQQVRVQVERRDMDEIFEILEAQYDLTTKTVNLVCGDRRGLVCGFWVSDSLVVPASLADEANYGSGALPWNDNWGDGIKTWVKQNVGFWTDVNGFASPTDGESFLTSRWI